MQERAKGFLRQGIILVAAFLPWLRVWDGTYALFFLVLVAGALVFLPALIFALLSAVVLLVLLPVAAVARPLTRLFRRINRVLRWTLALGLVLSLLYHLAASALIVFVTLVDSEAITPDDWWLRVASLTVGTLITAAATWLAARDLRAKARIPSGHG